MAVRKRKDRDSWEVYVVINGKRIRESHPTKKEALTRERELHSQRVTGTFPTTEVRETTFAEFVPEYLEWCELNKAHRTFKVEGYVINANLAPFFGQAHLTDITQREIERYKLKRKRDGVSARSINLELTILSVMFKRAIQNGYARDNPVQNVQKLKETKKPPAFLSEEEVVRLLGAAKDTYLYPLIVCALNTGMRKSELFNLKWAHVNFEANTITVQPDGDWHTKNYDFRTLEMTDSLRETLLSLHENRLSDEYVFTYGGEQLRSNVSRTWRCILSRAGLNHCTLHTLRHTFASHLAMQDVSLMKIQQLMGHSKYDTTLVYAHLSKESDKSEVHRLPFGKRSKEPSRAPFLCALLMLRHQHATKIGLSEIHTKKENAATRVIIEFFGWWRIPGSNR